jgi:hypothetical protein
VADTVLLQKYCSFHRVLAQSLKLRIKCIPLHLHTREPGWLSQYSVWLRTGRPDDRGSIPDRGISIFPLISVSRPALKPTQPPIHFVLGVLSPGVKRDRGVTLTTLPHLVPRSWMSRSYTSSPPCTTIGVLWDCFTLHLDTNVTCIHILVSLFCLLFSVSPQNASNAKHFHARSVWHPGADYVVFGSVSWPKPDLVLPLSVNQPLEPTENQIKL